MPITCKINLENSEKLVYAGQKLRITVRLKFTEETKVRGIYIHLRGKTHVRFMEDDSKREGSYVANENFLDMQNCLVSGNGGEVQLLPGTYDYSYQCTLPNDLPSSFLGCWGSIKYSSQVVINIPRWPDKTFKQKFVLLKPLDLNDFPSLRDAVSVQKEVTVELRRGYNKSSGGPFNISARIAGGAGYVPGQSIDVEIDVSNNDTQHAIVSFNVILFRKIIYFKSENSKHQKTSYAILNDQFATGCQPKQHKKFNLYLKVPKTVPTDTESSKLIKIEHIIQVFGFMGYYQKNFSLFLPITIGTKPLYGSPPPLTFPQGRQVVLLPSEPTLPTGPSTSEQSEPSAPQLSNDDTVSIRTYASTPPPFPDDDIDLPTYDEAMLLNFNDELDINLENIQYSFTEFGIKR